MSPSIMLSLATSQLTDSALNKNNNFVVLGNVKRKKEKRKKKEKKMKVKKKRITCDSVSLLGMSGVTAI